jgi:hypothetical protein
MMMMAKATANSERPSSESVPVKTGANSCARREPIPC